MSRNTYYAIKGKSEIYEGVSYTTDEHGNVVWIAQKSIGGKFYRSKGFATERDAAIYIDKALISEGKKPINVLKPLQQ